jgi:hypothetical protein
MAALSDQLSVLNKGVPPRSQSACTDYGAQGCTGFPLRMVIGSDVMDLVGSVTEVAVTVTVLPGGTCPGA